MHEHAAAKVVPRETAFAQTHTHMYVCMYVWYCMVSYGIVWYRMVSYRISSHLYSSLYVCAHLHFRPQFQENFSRLQPRMFSRRHERNKTTMRLDTRTWYGPSL